MLTDSLMLKWNVIYQERTIFFFCIYFTSFVLQIEKLFIIFNSATNAMETDRVKERVFYMSCFDRFTKLKRNDEIEVSVPLISFAIWQIFVWPSHAVRSNTLYALNRLIDSYRFFYESSRYLAGFPKAYLFSYSAAHWETAHCKYMSQKTIAFWAMPTMLQCRVALKIVVANRLV